MVKLTLKKYLQILKNKTFKSCMKNRNDVLMNMQIYILNYHVVSIFYFVFIKLFEYTYTNFVLELK